MLPWMIPMAVSAAGGLISNIMGNGSANKSRNEYDQRTAATSRYASQMGRQGRQVGQDALARMQGFDPMAAATQANEAQYSMAMPKIKQQLDDLRGGQAGQGRLRTGYGQGDQDQLLSTNLENLNQSMIARSMQAAQMQQSNTQQLAAYGQNQSNMYMDYATGMERSRYEQEMANSAGNRSMWGSLLGAGIQAAGSIFGSKA